MIFSCYNWSCKFCLFEPRFIQPLKLPFSGKLTHMLTHVNNVYFFIFSLTQTFRFRRYYVAPFFSQEISLSLLIYYVYALVLLNNAIYVNLAWNCLTETLAFPSSFSGNIKESHFPFACLPMRLLLCPGKTFIDIHLLSLPA